MGELKLLDCTLRDGGYVNDWKFGHDNIVSIFDRVVDAGTDVIEIGFLDDRRPFDIDRSIMPDTDSVGKIFGELDKKNTKVFGMIDYGTCKLENIKPCSESYLDGIRVIFKKHLRVEALEYVAELKKKGYVVFAQLVSVTSYSDEEMMDLISLANEVGPSAVSMVDTYGLMHQDNLDHYFELLNTNLDPSIGIGYHGHNNFQMAYANCIAMLSHNVDRTILVDGSLYGMGKSAGNASIELVAMHMNQCFGKKYHISQYLESIDSNIRQFYAPATWGYNMFFFIAALNDCHPSYVKQLMDKKTLSVKQINELLEQLSGDKKLLYDKLLMENLYMEYQKNTIDDTASKKKLSELLCGKSLLLVGPGKTMITEKQKIVDYVQGKDPIVISINYIPDYLKTDYVFLSNSKRYVQMATKLTENKMPVIATSNVTRTSGEFDYVLNNADLLDTSAKIIDNSFVMFLKTLIGVGVKEVSVAGFDGYCGEENNYFNSLMEYKEAVEQADYLNKYVSGFISENASEIKINFVTESKYIK